MKNLKELKLNASTLSREQMKNISGGAGAGTLPYCTSCCPTKPCKPYPHRICSDIACL